MAPVTVPLEKLREFEDFRAFYDWLALHHDIDDEVWIRIFKKASGRATISPVEAIDAVLCWGWIDAIKKSWDEISFVQRYCPRRSKSVWSQINRDNVARLTEMGLMTPHGLVHGDFGSNNVLVADGRISAVLDWSEAMTGDPAYDLANLFFWRPWLDCMEAQCSYIEVNEPYRSADAARLLRYQLRIGLQIRAEAQADADTRLVEWATHRCATVAAALNGPQEQGSAHRA